MKSRMNTLARILLAILVGLIAAQCTQPDGPAEEMEPTVEIIVPTPAPSVPVTLTYGSYWQGQGAFPARHPLVLSRLWS